jgi:predicted transposase YdaD
MTQRQLQSEDTREERADYDSFWKDLMEQYLYPLLRRILPKLYAQIDTSKAPRFLDKEFQDIINTGDPKLHHHPRFADKLAEVPLLGGDTKNVLLHAEAQGKGGENIAHRVHHYTSLIFAHYLRDPVTVVIITDKRPKNEPKFYHYNQFGTEIIHRYATIILADLDDEALLTSDNPIDLVLYAAKHAAECGEDRQRYHFLRLLTGLLGERGWDQEQKRNLLNFITRILYMEDPVLTAEYREYVQQLKEEGKVMYIPFFEREDAEKVRKEGRAEGKLEMARNLLAEGFAIDVIAKSAGLPLERIQALVN